MSLQDQIKTDVQKVETEAKAEVSKLESATYSGKILLVSIIVALVVGVFFGHIL